MLKQSPHAPTTEASSGDATRAHPSASESSTAVPSPAAVTPVVVCSNCQRVRMAPGDWRLIPHASGIPMAHGLCPQCVSTSPYAASVPSVPSVPSAVNLRTLRHMIQGNLDMARRLIRIGDAQLALRELEQATTKIDQFLNQLT
jgi:hypothetical protein